MLHIAPGNARGIVNALIKVSRSEMSCKRGQSSLLGLPSAADIMKRATCFMRGNAPWVVKGINGLRAFGAWHFCAGAKMLNVSIAVYVSPGRCPGLWATFGLTARPNHLPGVCANWFVFNRPLPRLGKGLKYVSSRALRIIFPEKPFNPALIRINVCIQTGCECIVCTSNPSLMTGLSCPDIGS